MVLALERALVACLGVIADDVARRPERLRVSLACNLVSGGMGGVGVVGVVGSVVVVAVDVADAVVASVDGGGCRERKGGGCGKSSATCSMRPRPRG